MISLTYSIGVLAVAASSRRVLHPTDLHYGFDAFTEKFNTRVHTLYSEDTFHRRLYEHESALPHDTLQTFVATLHETESASSSNDIASGSFSIPPGPAPLRRTAPGSPRPDAATGLAERPAPPPPAGAFFLPSAFFFGFAAGSSLPSLRPSSS